MEIDSRDMSAKELIAIKQAERLLKHELHTNTLEDDIDVFIDFIQVMTRHKLRVEGSLPPALVLMLEPVKDKAQAEEINKKLKSAGFEMKVQNIEDKEKADKYSFGLLPLHKSKSKDEVLEVVLKFINIAKPIALIHVCEAWATESKNISKDKMQEMMDGKSSVSELHESQRKEIVSFHCENIGAFRQRDIAYDIIRDPKDKTKADIAIAIDGAKAEMSTKWEKQEKSVSDSARFNCFAFKAMEYEARVSKTTDDAAGLINELLKGQ
jgi:hypothetical protein